MTESGERQQESGTENVGTGESDKAATGGEGTNPAQATPPIEGGGKPGQTQVPAGDEEVGVPDDVDGGKE